MDTGDVPRSPGPLSLLPCTLPQPLGAFTPDRGTCDSLQSCLPTTGASWGKVGNNLHPRALLRDGAEAGSPPEIEYCSTSHLVPCSRPPLSYQSLRGLLPDAKSPASGLSSQGPLLGSLTEDTRKRLWNDAIAAPGKLQKDCGTRSGI